MRSCKKQCSASFGSVGDWVVLRANLAKSWLEVAIGAF